MYDWVMNTLLYFYLLIHLFNSLFKVNLISSIRPSVFTSRIKTKSHRLIENILNKRKD